MGLRVKIIDAPLKEQVRTRKFLNNVENIVEGVYEKMLDDFRQIKTKIVGIACYTPEYFEVIELAKAIKAINNSVKIIVGGIHPTFYPEDFFDGDSGIDICVLGEGELTTYELCQVILKNEGDGLNRVKGIAYFDRAACKVIHTPTRPLAENLDDISFPDYSLIDMRYYTNANPYTIRGCFLRSIYLLATRGCPSQCTFCVAKKLREYYGTGRVRSAESLINELKQLKEGYAVDSFYFVDDLFTIDKENVKKFCALLKKEKLDLVWGCSSKVTTLNQEVLKIMAEADCVQIDFGVERGSDKALNLINKGQNIEMVKKIFGLCHEYKIRTFANMLVNLPQETEKDLNDILKLLDELKSEIISINVFTPYPGTEIYEKLQYKFKKEEYANLSKDPIQMIKMYPNKFKYSLHEIDLGDWVRKYNKRYNKICANLKFYLTERYLKILLNSKIKINYLKQLNLLLRELINQKFNY